MDDFHLGNITRGFMGSYMLNFNNGVPTDEMKDEIERSFTEKFAGHQNAGRVVFSWNRDKDAATTIEKIDIEDFGEKYNTLAKHSRTQIFAAFRANANLFGIPTENNGFNSEEYEASFSLFNRTMIRPVQMQIIDMFDAVAGRKDSLYIEPFTLKSEAEEAESEAAEMLAVRIGVGGTQSLTSIISNPDLTASQKIALLEKLFNYSPEEASRLFPNEIAQ